MICERCEKPLMPDEVKLCSQCDVMNKTIEEDTWIQGESCEITNQEK